VTDQMSGSTAAVSAQHLGETRLCPAWSCTNSLPCPFHPVDTGAAEELQPAADLNNERASIVLLAALAALARGQLDATSKAMAVAVARHPVLGKVNPERVLTVIRRTAGRQDVWERELIALALRRARYEYMPAQLWLAQIVDELIGPRASIGLWVDEQDGGSLRFERTAEGLLFPAVLWHERSRVAVRVMRLIALWEAIPAAEEPWSWILDHGAGRTRPSFLDEHGRREGISRHEVDTDAREAKRRLIASGRDGSLTPYLVACRDGGDWPREASRLRRFRKQNGLPSPFRRVLQGK
jgi:hypothetical protein